jgi:outer membrane protein
MNRGAFRLAILAACGVLLGLICPGSAPGATTGAFRIGYVDSISVLERAIPVRKEIEEAEKKIAPLQKSAEAKSDELEKLLKDLRNPSLLSKSELEKKQERAKTLENELDLATIQINREYRLAEDTTTSKAGQMIVKAIETVAVQKGVGLVLSKDSLLWAADSLDMTQDVIDYLNGGASGAKQTSSAAPAPIQPAMTPESLVPGGVQTLAPKAKTK